MTGFERPAPEAAGYGRLVVHRGGGGPTDEEVSRSRVALWLLLAAMAMIFASLVSAYLVRMDLGDWQTAPLPRIMWANTALLVGASAALQMALRPAETGEARRLARLLWVAGLCTTAFIAGQLAAWQQLLAMGYGVAANPGSSFFYLFTMIHGLHVVGGLVPWIRLLVRLRGGSGAPGAGPAAERDADPGPAAIAPALRLCAVYWHFLLGVWVLLFALMLLT